MITELTAEQKARIPEFVEKWTKIGLCTDPANRPEAEEGVRLSYWIAGLKPPEKIVWCGSPLAIGRARHLARKTTQPVRDTTTDSVFDLGVDWADSVVGSIQKLVWDSVGNSVKRLVWDSVGTPISRSLGFWRSYSLVHVASVSSSLGFHGSFSTVHGQHNANLYAYFDYFRFVCGMTKQTEKMLGVMRVAENANWWIPHRDICWICERPNRLIRDNQGRLHCEDGPALSYPDGFSIYSIHGVLLDEQVILDPGTQTISQIRKESNAEVKRIRIERFGWGEYLREVGATVLDVRDNDVEATKEALMITPDGDVVLVCACPSTSRVYSLAVPPTITTCAAAQDWLSGGLSHRVINGA